MKLRNTLALISILFCASAIEARDITQLELLRCTSFETKSQKLSCFESLIESLPMKAIEIDDSEDEEELASQPSKGFFGLSQKVRDKKNNVKEIKETYHATVVQVQEGNYRILYFTTEEGHVWRQVEARRFWYPKKESFKVTIVQGKMGNYQLKVNGEGEFASVKRLK